MERHLAFIPRSSVLALFLLATTLDSAGAAVTHRGTFHGENTGDQFGITLCNAGDVNGDGYEDLLVGANLEDTGGDAAGKCYLYFGSAFLDTVPDLVIIGAAGERFGSLVAGGGDLNGDGFADIAVAALGTGAGPSGKVYVFLGGAPPDTTPDLVLTGPGVDARFGHAVSMGGDLNADGFDDLVVAAPQADSTGVVYVYYGGNPPDTTADLVLRGESAGDWFGTSVSSRGDLDGDTYDDLVVGAYLNSSVYLWGGKVYVFFGGAGLDSIPDLEIAGENPGDGFGSAVVIGPDMNGDSYGELLVSSPYYDAGGGYDADAGCVYLFLGGPSLDGVTDGFLTGEMGEDNFGYALDAGDIDGDGLGDVIVGAPYYGGSGVQSGRVYFFQGSHPLDATPDYVDTGADVYDGLGISVAAFSMFTFYPSGMGSFAAGGWNIAGTGEARLYGEPVNPTAVGDEAGRVQEIFTLSTYPNPFSSSLHIGLSLPGEARVSLDVLDVAGRRVAKLYDGLLPSGRAEFTWEVEGVDYRSLPAGVYFVRLSSNGRSTARKVLLIR